MMSLYKLFRRCLMLIQLPLFSKHGSNVKFHPFSFFSFKNIELGSDIYIGPNAYFLASETKIVIGSKVMFGPGVSLIAGNHNTKLVGEYMFDVKIKTTDCDMPIIIEDDCWIGANVTILNGVTISKGSIVAAGSVVTRSCEPYSVIGGNPAKHLKFRFSDEELIEHLIILNNKKLCVV